MYEAKSQLLKLGKLAWKSEEVIIAKDGELWLRLTPYRENRLERPMSSSVHPAATERGGFEISITP